MTRPLNKEAPPYQPPSSAAIASAQNTLPALRLLLSQRVLYSRAKRWAFLRSVGISVIAVAAPIVTAVAPSCSVVVGAIAALWIFLARTLFVTRERAHSAKAADVQEQFDLLVFEMPALALREPRVSPEEISDLVGSNDDARANAVKQKLVDWYPVDPALDGTASIAIAQRANAAYSERLQRANSNVWLAITVLWAVVAVVVSLQLDLTVSQFLLGVALPLLPALLDVYEQWRVIRAAGAERRAIADGIERLIRETDSKSVTGEDLLVWQDQLYALRRNAPQVPNVIYRRTRKKNELAMNAAAAELATAAKANAARRDKQRGA